MHQPALVSHGQALGHFASDAQRFGERQPLFAAQASVERFACEELHHDIRASRAWPT